MATVLSHQNPTRPKPKTHVSLGSLPPFISSKEPPTRKSPWRQIRDMPFISSVTLTLPNTLYTSLWDLLILQPNHPSTSPHYAKVILKLSDILTGDFFTTYIKLRTVLLISEGTPGVSDWVCTIHDGQMRIEMAREIYERCGIQGLPADRNGGARMHGKDRWVVEFNLRETAMVRGRKGFERLIRAAEQVLDQGKVWLFQDQRGTVEEGKGEMVIDRFHPTVVKMEPEIFDRKNVLVPTMISDPQGTTTKSTSSSPPSASDIHDTDAWHSLTEWLDLIHLDSPRPTATDHPDPYISRYVVPDPDTATTADLKVVRWTGLLDRTWCTELLVAIVRHCRGVAVDSGGWVACSFGSHRTEAVGQVDGCVVLLRPGAKNEEEEEDEEEEEKEEGVVTVGEDGMEVDNTGRSDGDVTMTTTESKRSTGGGGSMQFACFQFVDTLR